MAYLEPSEYIAFGLSADTSDAWISAASAMIEADCKRGSLLSTTYVERLRVARMTGCVQLTYGPVSQISALRGRYGVRSTSGEGVLLEWAVAFGSPGQWVTIDPSSCDVDTATGELRLPWNLLGLQFSEVEVTYTGGLQIAPDAVKVACAQIVKNAQATPGLNVRSSKLDTLQTQYFSDSLMDSQVRSLLRPYVAERLG